MTLESKVHAEVGLNTRRLSAMIESFHDSNDDEFLFVRRSDSNSPLREEDIHAKQIMQSPPASPSHFPKRSSTNSTMSPLKSSSTMSNYSHHKDSTIESISSEYTASIHEGLPISYVVAKNSVKDIRYDVKVPQVTPQDDRRHTLALGAHARVEDNYKFPRQNASPTRKSLRLVPSQQLSHRKTSSLGSYSIGSDFSYSRFQPEGAIRTIGKSEYMRDSMSQEITTPTTLCGDARYSNGELVDIKEEQVNPETFNPSTTLTPNTTISPFINGEKTGVWPKQSNDSRSTSHSLNTTPLRVLRNGSSTTTQRSNSAIADSTADTGDMSSLASSVVPSLKTNVLQRQQSGMLPDRSVTTDYQPSIPARSKNRPKSALLLHQGLENIQKELEKEMAPHGEAAIGHSRNTSTSTATKSESYFSASDQPINMSVANDIFTSEHVQHRPGAPIIPRGDRTISNTTITKNHQSDVLSAKRIDAIRTERIRRSTVPLDDEDEWEDENVYVNGNNEPSGSHKQTKSLQPTPQHSPARSSHHKSKHDSKSSKRKSIRSMDVDTISHLLNATKGTLVGSEFTNLGIRPEEKRALERLVDSLSRLTADMIVDPERYAEGLKRLDKATKALDGF